VKEKILDYNVKGDKNVLERKEKYKKENKKKGKNKN